MLTGRRFELGLGPGPGLALGLGLALGRPSVCAVAAAVCLASLGGATGALAQEGLARVEVATQPEVAATTPKLRREGDFVVKRVGRLVNLADGALAVVFDPPAASADTPAASADPPGAVAPAGVDSTGLLPSPPAAEPVPDLPPMVLQPGRMLEALLAVRDSGEADAKFSLSGRVQRYRGRNHLLVTGFEGVQAPSPAPPAPPALSDFSGGDASTANRPAAEPDGATDAVAALMSSLDADGRAATASPPAAVLPPEPAPGGGAASGWRDAELVHRRLGRVVASGPSGSHPGSVFVFDGGDPPLRLLASAATERAERLNEGLDDSLVFELSGQVQVSGREAWVLPSSLRFRPAAGRVDEPSYP